MMKAKLRVLGIVVLVSLIVIPAGLTVAAEFKAASVAEIRSLAIESQCAKKMLLDANREAREILRRDLKKVRDRSVSIDEQAKAFD